MDNPSTSVSSNRLRSPISGWRSLEENAGEAFLVGGLLMIASAIMPVALSTLTNWAWVTGILLIGIGTLSVAAGLLGLHPTLVDQSPGLARLGAVAAGIAALGAVALASMGSVAGVFGGALGLALPKPTMAFKLVALTAAAGLAVGLLAFGVAAIRTAAPTRSIGGLLTGGGVVLLLPVVNESLRLTLGTGVPSWILFPAIGLLAFDAVAIGFAIRSEEKPRPP